MKFIELDLKGVILIEPKVFKDTRGLFFEWYNENIFGENGIRAKFVQDNHSLSSKGTLRGLHFQVPPKAQGKLIRVLRGEVYDVVVDIRKDSKTFGRHVSITLSGDDQKMLFVPEGVAHGFLTLSDNTEFLYKVTDFYSPDYERGIIYNDTTLKIEWPKLDVAYTLSDRDQKLPTFNDLFATVR